MKLVTGLPTGRCGHALRAFEDRTWAPYSWANSLRMLFVWSAFIRVPDKNLPPSHSHHPDRLLCLKAACCWPASRDDSLPDDPSATRSPRLRSFAPEVRSRHFDRAAHLIKPGTHSAAYPLFERILP